jgi:hypothetical protein
MSEATEAASPQAATPEPASGGLDAILSSAIDKYDEQPEAAPEKTTETPEPKVDATGRAHAPDGKFTNKKSATAEPSEQEPAKTEAAPAPAAVDPAQAVQPVEPHARWSAELKAEFTKWSPEVQKAFKDRYGETEADYTRKTQELAETRKGIEPLLSEVQRQDPVFKHLGVSPQQFLEQSANVARALLSGTPEQRGQAIAYLVNHHRIPPEAVLQALGVPLPAAGENGHMAVDPVVPQLRQQLHGLEQTVQQMREQATLAEHQRVEAEFNALGQAKDQNGQARFPHFERVKQTMIQLAATSQAETWDQAYTKAVRLDDDLYQQTVEAERSRVSDAAEKARLEAVEKAKKASARCDLPIFEGRHATQGYRRSP